MKIAFILFNGITYLDFVGFYDVIYRLNMFEKTKGLTWDICGLDEEITDELGMKVKVNSIKPNLKEYDILFVPGGLGTRTLRNDKDFIYWLKEADSVKYKISVCTGSLLLGAAGFLEGRKATTHPKAYQLLEPYCQEVIRERIVRDGNIFTGGGVATSIDLGLYILGLFAGEEAKKQVKEQIDYPYECPRIIEY